MGIACVLSAFMLSAQGSDALPERTPAFPGAEGWGRYVTGGRGGKVLHVTNLRDGGRGSLRWALEQTGPRIIVFDVSGTIHLESDLRISQGNVTIAGQTAPGDGICIADFPVSISTRNVIIRYIRFRPGNLKSTNLDGLDALSCNDTERIMIDHCSLSWSTDECCSVYGNRFTTVQWCIISQSLRYGGHSKVTHGYGGMMGGEGASYHHNLIAHHDSRTPRLGERPETGPRDSTDFRNNVIYNWSGNGCYGAENMNVNIVNNYYKPGGATNQRNTTIRRRICGVGVNENENNAMYLVWAKLYVTGNVNPNFADVTRDNWNYGIIQQIDSKYRNDPEQWNFDADAMHLSEPMKYYYTTTHTADKAFEKVLDYAGASLSRDWLDALMVSDTRDGVATYKGSGSGNGPGIIDSPYDNKPADAGDDWSPWPTLVSTEAPVDTDQDGMPDAWETEHGLDPNDPADANLKDSEGYTMVEVYINSLVAHITDAQNADGVADGYTESIPQLLDEYVISTETREAGTWTFGHGITLSNSRNGSYVTKGVYIGVGRDIQHTITLPEYARITKVKFEGTARFTSDSYTDAFLKEFNGVEYTAYSLPKGETPATFEIIPDEPLENSVTMTWTGNNPYLKITLYTTAQSGIEGVTVDDTLRPADDRWFNLQGVCLGTEQPAVPGIYIHAGKKILIK